jgi:hypothetical protein
MPSLPDANPPPLTRAASAQETNDDEENKNKICEYEKTTCFVIEPARIVTRPISLHTRSFWLHNLG